MDCRAILRGQKDVLIAGIPTRVLLPLLIYRRLINQFTGALACSGRGVGLRTSRKHHEKIRGLDGGTGRQPALTPLLLSGCIQPLITSHDNKTENGQMNTSGWCRGPTGSAASL